MRAVAPEATPSNGSRKRLQGPLNGSAAMSGGPLAASHQRETGSAPSTPDAREVLAGLERILASGEFDSSPRSRAFVRFIVEETLAGREEGLTQATIAVRVLERREGFDPTVDPIVRIQAGRLRRSLERYYLLGGAGDPVRIELPRGSYVPVLRWAGPADAQRAQSNTTQAAEDRGGWPLIILSMHARGERDVDGATKAARFLDHLAVELDRYRDVRVVFRHEQGRLPSSPCKRSFGLTGQLPEEDGPPRVAVRLQDCGTARQVWAEEYRGDQGHPADFYRETARVVAARVASEQGIVAQTLMGANPPPDEEATIYGALLRSYRFFGTRQKEDFVPTLEALRRAVASDPECALAWVQLSRLHVANHAFEIAPAETSIEQGLAFAHNAVRLDPSSQRARAALAFALLVKGETAACLVETESALALNPETFVYLETLGWILTMLGEWDQGTALVRRAIAHNPHHLPVAHLALWADHLRRGEIEEAYQAALRYRDPGFYWRSLMRASCLGHLGRLEEARVEVAELLRYRPDFARRGRTLIGRLLKAPELQARVAGGLAKAGLALN